MKQCLKVFKDKLSKKKQLVLIFQKMAWIQVFTVISLLYTATICMAFVDIHKPSLIIKQVVKSSLLVEHVAYEGVVTIIGDEVVLKTHRNAYVLDDPYNIIQKSPKYAKNSQLQSFRICVEGERQDFDELVQGQRCYLLKVKRLCV